MEKANNKTSQESYFGINPDEMYRADEVGAILKTSRQTVHKWANDGIFRRIRLGRFVRFFGRDLIDACQIESKGDGIAGYLLEIEPSDEKERELHVSRMKMLYKLLNNRQKDYSAFGVGLEIYLSNKR